MGGGAEVALAVQLNPNPGGGEREAKAMMTAVIDTVAGNTNEAAKMGTSHPHRRGIIIDRLNVIVNDLKRRGGATEIIHPATIAAAIVVVRIATAAAPPRQNVAIPNATKNHTKNHPTNQHPTKPPPTLRYKN